MEMSQVRDYIQARMAIVEPNLDEWVDSLSNIGNIPATELDNSYHITLNAGPTTNDQGTWIETQQSVTLTIFKYGFNDPQDTRDELMETANCIRLDMINPLNVEAFKSANDSNIEAVQFVAITPSEIDASNDNVLQVEIELIVRLFFGVT